MLRRPKIPAGRRPGLARRARSALAPMLLTAALAAGAATPLRAQAPADSAVTALVDVHVVPMDRERVLEHQTLLVRDGRIAEIGPVAEVRVPAGARVVQGRGRYVMPGLAEMHAHIPPTADDEAAIERTLTLYAVNGVATARGMLGHPHHLRLRAQAERNEILSPRIFTSGPSLNGNSVPTAAVAERTVREQKAAGYDFLKLHPGLALEVFETIDRVADEVGIDYAGHVSEAVGLERALQAGYASIDHLDSYVRAMAADAPTSANSGLFGILLTPWADESAIPRLARATREAGVWNVPTQSLMENLALPPDAATLAQRPEMRYMPASTVAQWVQAKRDFQSQPGFSPELARDYIELRRRLIKGLHDAGAGLLLGSDAPQVFNVPGFALQHELEMLVAAGLTPYQALETGTRNPALFFGEQDRWGTLQPGQAADLILLDANPLHDIRALRDKQGVMLRGRWLDRARIEHLLRQLESA